MERRVTARRSKCHALLLEYVKLLAVRGVVKNIRGHIAAAVKIARDVSLPLAQRQRDISALQ